MVVHVKWSLETDGFIEAWVWDIPAPSLPDVSQPSYTPVVFSNNSTRLAGITAGNELGNFFKMGIYRKQGVNDGVTGIIYYDEFKRSNSFAEVALPPQTISD